MGTLSPEKKVSIDRFPNYCLGTSNGAWPVAKGRAIASFPYFPYGRVEKRQWEDGQEGEERRLWQSERLVECFLTKGIFETAKTSHQRKHILLGEWSGSFQSPSGSGVCVPGHKAYWSLFLVLPSQSLVVSVNIVNSKDYKTPFLFPLLFRRP